MAKTGGITAWASAAGTAGQGLTRATISPGGPGRLHALLAGALPTASTPTRPPAEPPRSADRAASPSTWLHYTPKRAC